jgi:hypothetical protein
MDRDPVELLTKIRDFIPQLKGFYTCPFNFSKPSTQKYTLESLEKKHKLTLSEWNPPSYENENLMWQNIHAKFVENIFNIEVRIHMFIFDYFSGISVIR